MTWQDIKSLDKKAVAVLGVSATEQHGPHLPLGTDAYILEGVIKHISKIIGDDASIFYLPALTIGKSNEHLNFPGTLALSKKTLYDILFEIGQSLHNALGLWRISIQKAPLVMLTWLMWN